MKDKKELVEKLETVTADIFFRFLDEKKVTKVCQMCNSYETQVVAETIRATMEDVIVKGHMNDAKVFVTFFRHTPEQQTDGIANYYYKLSCDNCGYITTHEVKPVLEWLAVTESKSEEGSHNE